jgi:hypothetical protein
MSESRHISRAQGIALKLHALSQLRPSEGMLSILSHYVNGCRLNCVYLLLYPTQNFTSLLFSPMLSSISKLRPRTLLMSTMAMC